MAPIKGQGSPQQASHGGRGGHGGDPGGHSDQGFPGADRSAESQAGQGFCQKHLRPDARRRLKTAEGLSGRRHTTASDRAWGSAQRLAGHPVAVAIQVGVPLPQEILSTGKAADLPAGQLPAAVGPSRGRWRSSRGAAAWPGPRGPWRLAEPANHGAGRHRENGQGIPALRNPATLRNGCATGQTSIRPVDQGRGRGRNGPVRELKFRAVTDERSRHGCALRGPPGGPARGRAGGSRSAGHGEPLGAASRGRWGACSPGNRHHSSQGPGPRWGDRWSRVPGGAFFRPV